MCSRARRRATTAWCGGDRPEGPDSVPGGLLGRRLRDRRRPLPDSPRSTAASTGIPSCARRSPSPGVEVKAGEYLLAVDGVRSARRPTTSTPASRTPPAKSGRDHRRAGPDGPRGPHRHGGAGRATSAACATATGSRATSARCDEATDGRVAYVYVPNTTTSGPHLLQALLLPPGPQGRDHRRRAPQRRRPGGGLLHRHPAPALRRALGDALRRRPRDAAGGDRRDPR